jgi:hypothetical protein
MKIFITFITVLLGLQLQAQTVYTASRTWNNNRDIPTDRTFRTPDAPGECIWDTLQVRIPANVYIVGVDVEYAMTAVAANNGWISDQISRIRCISPGGMAEDELYYGEGSGPGTLFYQRTDLDIANFVEGGGTIIFEMNAGRLFPTIGQACNTTFNKVDNNTWKVTVHYQYEPPVYRTLTVEAPEGTGKLKPAPGVYKIIEGKTVSVSAEAAVGWQFGSWMGDVANPSAEATTLIMDSDKTIKASFVDLDQPVSLLPFFENFTGVAENTLPAGWSRNNNQWYVRNTNNAGGTSPEVSFVRTEVATRKFNLYSPKLWTEPTSRMELSFTHQLSRVDRGSHIRVMLSVDGINWQELWSVRIGGDNIPITAVTIPLPDVSGMFYLSWVYDGYSLNVNSWNIDNIRIKAAPVLHLSATDVPFGQPVSASSLAGSTASLNGVDVAGTFEFVNPTLLLPLGTHEVDVTFTPTDLVKYFATTGKVSLTVVQYETEILTYPVASGIAFGQALASSNLSGGTASVSGTFAFADASIKPSAGVYQADVVFTPDDNAYKTIFFKVDIDVAKATPVVTWPIATDITYGQTISSSALSGGSASSFGVAVPGTFVWNTPALMPVSGTHNFMVTFTPEDTDNYEVISNGSVQLLVNKKDLFIAADDKTKVYDGQTFSGFTVTYTGFVAGETVTNLGGSLSFTGTAVAAVNAGSSYVITPGGLTSTNYDITFQSGTLAITPAALAIKADDKTKVYDGQTFSGFTVTYTGFVAGETVTNLGGSLSFTGTAVAAVNAGSSYMITPGGLTSTNYDITFQNGTLAITPAALAIKADDKTKVYDGQTFSGFTVTYTGFVAGETVTNLGGSLSFTGTAVAAVNAGSSYVITPGGLTSTNYDITFQNGTLAITPAALVIKADDKTKVYDGQTFSGFTVTYTGFVAGETVTNLGGSLSFTGTAVAAVNAGSSYVITPGGLTSTNYDITFQNGTLAITPAALAIKADDKTKVYDGQTFSGFTVTYTGFVAGETVTNLGGSLSFTGTAVAAVNAGSSYVITPGGLTSTNYDITFQNGTLAITPAALAIKADDKTKVYDGQTFSGFTVTYTGFVAGETVTNLGGSLSFTGTAVAAVNAGSSYVITPGGLTSTNYDITFQNGTLAITPAALAIKADDKTKVYDGQTFSGFTVTYTGFVAGETVTNLGGSLSFTGTAVAAVNAVAAM